MITNAESYAANHQRICKRAEIRFKEDCAQNPKFSLARAIKKYSLAVYSAIERRDSVAAVWAISAAHLALHGTELNCEFVREETTSCLVR